VTFKLFILGKGVGDSLLFVSLSGGNIESRKLGLRGGKGGTAVLTTENPSSLPDNFDI
jgi:hypothetical protein